MYYEYTKPIPRVYQSHQDSIKNVAKLFQDYQVKRFTKYAESPKHTKTPQVM